MARDAIAALPVSDERLREALRLAVPIIEQEREVMVRSYTVLYKGSPDFGKVVDADAVKWIEKVDAALSAARQALNSAPDVGA
jgi:hypothetical protein